MEKRLLSLVLILVAVFSGCRTLPLEEAGRGMPSYASDFENTLMQEQFNTLSERVLRVVSYVGYETQVFEPGSNITLEMLKSDGVELSGVRTRQHSNESFGGTALVVSTDDSAAVLLTCRHVVSYPDTVFSYDDRADRYGNRYLLGISVKSDQLVVVSDGRTHWPALLCSEDPENDLALIRIQRYFGTSGMVSLLAVDDSGFPRWGDRVWMLGYPSGKAVLTGGILSRCRDNDRLLVTDAPFSEGCSGAAAFVWDNYAGVFRLAGIGRSVAARTRFQLRPESRIHEKSYNTSLPYRGAVFIDPVKEHVPGVTFIIPAPVIMNFLDNTDTRCFGPEGLSRNPLR